MVLIPQQPVRALESLEPRMLLSIAFDDPIPFDVGAGPVAVAVADFDGNGTPDLATANFLAGTVSIVRRGPEGVVGTQNITVGSGPRGIAAGRVFSGNGSSDLVVSNFADGTISLLRNDGQGVFSLEQTIEVGEGPWSVSLAAVGSPGAILQDIVVTLFTESTIGLLRNDGSGSFAGVQKLAMPSGPLDIVSSTGLAGTGLGLAATLPDAGSVALLDTSGGQLTLAATLAVAGEPWAITANDLTGNGLPDIAISLLDTARIAVFLNSGGGTYAAPLLYETIDRPWALAIADFNQDGQQDLAVASNSQGLVDIFLNTGAAQLEWSGSFELEGPLTAIVAADMDGDGGEDVVVGQYALGAVSHVGVSPGDRAGLAGAVTGSGSAAGLLTVTTVNSDGHVIAFIEQPGGTWQAQDLHTLPGRPVVTGQVEVWHDPKDDLSYAAATSTEGLLLFRRSGDGVWSVRNLNDELLGAGLLIGDITVFVSKGNKAYIAGLDAGGDLYLFNQTGASGGNGFVWTARSLSDTDLLQDGKTTPAFAGGLISFVTSWNALNIAGLDSNGDIQAVWFHRTLPRWTASNLSDSTGAPPLAGGLTAYLTSWNGINLVGTDASGNVSATWWVPSFGAKWETSNLTSLIGGPQFRASSVTSFVTRWGATNIAGVDTDGKLTVYWWVPGQGHWTVSPLSDVIPDATVPEGQIRGVTVTATGSINILGAGPDGDVLRYWWIPGGTWQIENLTQQA